VTGLIDLGRLGRADPHADTALLLANAREVWPDEASHARARTEFDRLYGFPRDAQRQEFYLRLDPLTW
jgi:streptomycin 3"-kinase